ncbi:MAG: aminotransferase class IV [Acidobacteriia bacterium]|nr:aminotransferase class IV [Terriglobia bacterium]
MNQPLVWINGQFVEYGSAKVSIEDRGFQFCDGIYEVVRAVEGRFYGFQEHLDRMRRSLHSVEIEVSMSDSDFRRIAERMLAESHERDATLYVQITRGAAPRSHAIPPDITPTVIMVLRRLHPVEEAVQTNGIKAITVKDERWARCDIKLTGLLPNVLAREKARRAHVEDAIFVRESWVTEGTSTNVFVALNDELVTPRADHRILKGITRDAVLLLARKSLVKTAERDLAVSELKAASEVFLTSTTMEVLPVVEIDHIPVGTGKVGPLTRRLMEGYRDVLHGKAAGESSAP